jgi:hypothetical protein
MIDEKAGVEVLLEIVRLLDSGGLNYWLGRGVFRQVTLHGAFGDQQGDIDFHVLRSEQKGLAAVVDALEGNGYRVISTPDQRHKITMRKGHVEIEFVFLDRDREILWHQAGWPERKRYDCPAKAFGDRRIEIFGASIRVPDEEYLPAVFGRGWRRNRKGAGGRRMTRSEGRTRSSN